MIHTQDAPQAIGSYSQAIAVGELVFLSGQIAMTSVGEFLGGSAKEQLHQILGNLSAVCGAAGGTLDNIVKLTIYLTDLNDFDALNEVMSETFHEPYPARAVIQVSALPKGAAVEADAIMTLEK